MASFGVLGDADDHSDILDMIKAKQETSSKKRLDEKQEALCRTLKYPDRSLREFIDSCEFRKSVISLQSLCTIHAYFLV